MTDQERLDISERAELEGKILADVVIPRLRGEIWKASATTSLIAGFILFSWYRSDFAALKTELRGVHPAPVQTQQQQITVKQAEGLLERETKRLLETEHDGDVRRIDATDYDVASGPSR